MSSVENSENANVIYTKKFERFLFEVASRKDTDFPPLLEKFHQNSIWHQHSYLIVIRDRFDRNKHSISQKNQNIGAFRELLVRKELEINLSELGYGRGELDQISWYPGAQAIAHLPQDEVWRVHLTRLDPEFFFVMRLTCRTMDQFISIIHGNTNGICELVDRAAEYTYDDIETHSRFFSPENAEYYELFEHFHIFRARVKFLLEAFTKDYPDDLWQQSRFTTGNEFSNLCFAWGTKKSKETSKLRDPDTIKQFKLRKRLRKWRLADREFDNPNASRMGLNIESPDRNE